MSIAQTQRTRVASYGLILSDGHILLSRYAQHLPEAGHWNLPGGGIEFGEHPEEAMIREVFEETGLTVKASGLLGFDSISGQAHDHTFHHIRFVYAATVLSGTLTSESDESSDLCEWHSEESLANIDKIELVEVALKMCRNDN